jgi:hypothetical protein
LAARQPADATELLLVRLFYIDQCTDVHFTASQVLSGADLAEYDQDNFSDATFEVTLTSPDGLHTIDVDLAAIATGEPRSLTNEIHAFPDPEATVVVSTSGSSRAALFTGTVTIDEAVFDSSLSSVNRALLRTQGSGFLRVIPNSLSVVE